MDKDRDKVEKPEKPEKPQTRSPEKKNGARR
jgi:hypothetical protein